MEKNMSYFNGERIDEPNEEDYRLQKTMTTPLQTYKDMMSELREEFNKFAFKANTEALNGGGGDGRSGEYALFNKIADWWLSKSHTSFIKFLESEIEHWKGEKYDENDINNLTVHYNSAISKVIDHYQQLIEETK